MSELANRLDQWAAELEQKAQQMRAAAQLIRRPKLKNGDRFDTVPAAAVAAALSDGEQIELEEAIERAKAAPAPAPAMRPAAEQSVQQRTPPKRGRKRDCQGEIRAYLLENGPESPGKIMAALKMQPVQQQTACKALVAAGEIERMGGKAGPGVLYRLKHRVGVAPAAVTSSQIRPAAPPAPPAPARQAPEPEREIRRPTPPALPAILPNSTQAGGGEPMGAVNPKAMHRAELERQRIDKLVGEARQELLKAGDRGLRPGELRAKLELSQRDAELVINKLLDSGEVARVPRADSEGSGNVLRMRGRAMAAN